jgi:hypothetical protein
VFHSDVAFVSVSGSSIAWKLREFVMAMSAAELLLSAEPPVDDADIEKALADLDVKIWTWTDAMMSAQAALRNSYAQRPAVYPPMGQFDDADTVPGPAVPAYTPAAPAENASFAPAPSGFGQPHTGNEWRPTFVDSSSGGGEPAAAASTAAWPTGNWPTQADAVPAPPAASAGGWPSAGGGQWKPASSTPAATTPDWSSWSGAGSPSQGAGDTGSGGSPRKSAKQVKAAKAPPIKPAGPTPEELAARAEAETAQLAQLDEATVRRVKLLRRLDPDAPMEKLIEKARQAHQPTEAGPKDEKSSWWRRK